MSSSSTSGEVETKGAFLSPHLLHNLAGISAILTSRLTMVKAVVIKLFADDNIKELPKRSITLTRSNDTLQIGRASKVATKGFVAAANNAWFDSPIMSRNHAEIVANTDDEVC